MDKVRDGCVGGRADNEARAREEVAIGGVDHPRTRWGGQAITSWGRRGTGLFERSVRGEEDEGVCDRTCV